MRARLSIAVLFGLLAVVAAGCERSTPLAYVSAPELADLDAPLRRAIRDELKKRCGTPQVPKLLGGSADEQQRLSRGAAVYERYCIQCHGVTGDGSGEAAKYLNPHPRDYRRGIFKFTSTGYGNKPRREDLIRTITRGVRGTSMPSFERLSKPDVEAVVDYVLSLTHRGELEILLIAQAQGEGELTEEALEEQANIVIDQWKEARHQVIEPVTKMPDYSPEAVAAGGAVFQKRECFKCHGRDGRGGLAGNIEVGQDAWGFKTAAADLTSGMLHGGSRPIDIYRRIYAGINGTPMPAFADILAQEPDTIWQLVQYVLHLSDERRRGMQFPASSNAQGAPPPSTASQPSVSGQGSAATPDGTSGEKSTAESAGPQEGP